MHAKSIDKELAMTQYEYRPQSARRYISHYPQEWYEQMAMHDYPNTNTSSSERQKDHISLSPGVCESDMMASLLESHYAKGGGIPPIPGNRQDASLPIPGNR